MVDSRNKGKVGEREASEIKHFPFKRYCIDTLYIDLGEEEEKEECQEPSERLHKISIRHISKPAC